MKVYFAPDVLNDNKAWYALDIIIQHFIEERHLWAIDDPDEIMNSE